MNNKSTQALQDYIRYSKYAKYIKSEKRRETWKEQVARVFRTHRAKYKDKLDANPKLEELFQEAQSAYEGMLALGSQRILQWAGDVNNSGAEDPILKHQARVYNCVVTPVDRDRAFSEIMYMLLAGCGVGFSVMEHQIVKLPTIKPVTNDVEKYTVEDSIEGWALAFGVLLASYFRQSHDDEFGKYYGKRIDFDFSKVRAKGTYITGGFKAPGPDGLKKSLLKVREVIENRISSIDFGLGEFAFRLRTVDAYDIIMHESDAVLSGGVRRSASICLFGKGDKLMLKAKTGNWFLDNPQRGRSNNSILLLRGDTTKQEFEEIMESVKQFGEPGFVWTDDLDILFNPCVEIGMYPYSIKEDGTKKSGFQGCNLCEINGKAVKTAELFEKACRAAAIMGTLQAGYTDFKFLTRNSKRIFDREALLGVSITGFMDNPTICLNDEILKMGAHVIKEVNEQVAAMIGINPAARTTCVKPSGTTSLLLGTSSGIHGHHARRYIRHVQVNKDEISGQIYQEYNPAAVEESTWSSGKTDNIIAFLVESNPEAILREDLLNSKQLEFVKQVQQSWVEAGTNVSRCVNPVVRHNVSNTIDVTDWKEVTDYIYDNRAFLAGISFLSSSGDKDYAQAPRTEVLTSQEILNKYGEGTMFASGLIVDGLHAFGGNLWLAIDTAIRYNNPDHTVGLDLVNGRNIHELQAKIDWCIRFEKFAKNYTSGNRRKCNYLLKDVFNLHKWNKITVNYKPIDWDNMKATEEFTDVDTMGSIACAGGTCELP
jgi:ribonucleoside-triphosphate reductase